MTHILEHTLLLFLKEHLDSARPVLLALSGGPDSLALLHVLDKIRKKLPLHIGIAHIDHAWREESAQEAEDLRKIVEKMGLRFHLKRLDISNLSGNLEAACRRERLKFYKELSQRDGYQAVLLAHHANDQAETVLKRVLEGAELSSLSGLRPVTVVEGVSLWRPWLAVSKTIILSWLAEHNLVPFNDRTNQDQKFLRARMRQTIIPTLEERFGKQVSNNLCLMGQDAQELEAFLSNSLSQYLANIEKGPFGSMLDLSHDCPQHTYALKYLLKQLLHSENVPITRTLLENACELILSKKSDRQLLIGSNHIHIDRQRIFVVTAPKNLQTMSTPLADGISMHGPWKVSVQSVQHVPESLQIGWRSLWSGTVEAILPKGEYRLAQPKMSTPYPGESAPISKWWNNEKIPAFLRSQVPVIWQDHHIRHEFLTMRPLAPAKGNNLLHITLKFHH